MQGMVWSGRGCGGGQSRSAVMQYCHGDLRGPFHTDFFSLHCEFGGGSSNCHTKTLSWSSQERAVLSFAFRKPWLLLVQVDLRKKCVSLRAGVGLGSILKLFILNLKCWSSIISLLGLFSWTNGKNTFLKQFEKKIKTMHVSQTQCFFLCLL